MKKTVLVLGCLLAIGFSSVSCNRDDGMPEAQVTPAPTPTPTPTPTPPPPPPASTVISKTDLPTIAQNVLSAILESAPAGVAVSERYVGETVTYAKLSAANAQNGALYEVTFSNGIKLGFREDGSWAYADGNGTPLRASIWSYLPLPVQTSVRGISATAITEIVKMEVSTTNVYTITLQDGTVKKYNEDGTVAP